MYIPVVENLKINFTQDDLFPPADISSQKSNPKPGVASTSTIIQTTYHISGDLLEIPTVYNAIE